MHFTSLLAASAVAAVVSAHGDDVAIPKLFGRSAIADLKARNIFAALPDVAVGHQHAPVKRQDVGGTDGQCGPDYGSCNAGYCCSPAVSCTTPELAIVYLTHLTGLVRYWN